MRATILQRGTQRVWLAVAGLALWALLALTIEALASPPVFALLPLVVLAAAFEAVYAVHTAVERVGRYVQVFFEEAGDGWEHTAMAYGAAFKGGGIDPLFCAYFWSATLLNLIPMLLAEPVTPEWIVLGAAHLAVVWRILVARRTAAGQRAVDLVRFKQLRDARPPRA